MKKRVFLKNSMLLAASAIVLPLVNACKSGAAKKSSDSGIPPIPPPVKKRSTPFELPKLPYGYDALEPHIDKLTMEIHHSKHHQAYVNNLNDAAKGTPYETYELEDILMRITTADADKKIRNNAGGHWNHQFFWNSMTPGGAYPPSGSLMAAIDRDLGGMDKFKEAFTSAAKGVFGSGWSWLVMGTDKKLAIVSTPNQDNPLMAQIVKGGARPLLAIDVWEHAYYLKHQNKRADYISAFYNVINWKEVSLRFEQAMG